MEINEANKNYSDELSENDITTQDKINFSLELAESLSRKWESRCNLLDLVLERIKTKDCTLDNVKQMLSQNYERKSLHKIIKERAGNKHSRKWWKNIEDWKNLQKTLFPFDVEDEQFCKFLILSKKWDYDISSLNFKISSLPGYKDLLEKKKDIEKEIEGKKKQLAQQYKSSSTESGHLDHRRVSEDYQYYAAQDEKEKFINDWILSLNREKAHLENKLSKIVHGFYVEYPYLQIKK